MNMSMNQSTLKRGAGKDVQTNKIQLDKPINIVTDGYIPAP